jgi:hypothetical protein
MARLRAAQWSLRSAREAPADPADENLFPGATQLRGAVALRKLPLAVSHPRTAAVARTHQATAIL